MNRTIATGRRGTAPGSQVPDPVAPRYFGVRIEGVEIGYFTEVSGLEMEFEVFKHEEGGENGFVHQFRGRAKHPNLVLKRGITHEDAFLKWLLSTQTGTKRSTVTLTMHGPDGTPVRRWAFRDAFPVKWTGPAFTASSNEAASESLEIAHHGFVPAAG